MREIGSVREKEEERPLLNPSIPHPILLPRPPPAPPPDPQLQDPPSAALSPASPPCPRLLVPPLPLAPPVCLLRLPTQARSSAAVPLGGTRRSRGALMTPLGGLLAPVRDADRGARGGPLRRQVREPGLCLRVFGQAKGNPQRALTNRHNSCWVQRS